LSGNTQHKTSTPRPTFTGRKSYLPWPDLGAAREGGKLEQEAVNKHHLPVSTFRSTSSLALFLAADSSYVASRKL